MEPYTAEGMVRKEEATSGDDPADQLSQEDGYITITCGAPSIANQINYELVGVVVHSGQANAGHYYSFIKDRRLGWAGQTLYSH